MTARIHCSAEATWRECYDSGIDRFADMRRCSPAAYMYIPSIPSFASSIHFHLPCSDEPQLLASGLVQGCTPETLASSADVSVPHFIPAKLRNKRAVISAA